MVFRRVTSIMTDDINGFSKNNIWREVSLQRPGEDFKLWVPSEGEILKSNNIDIGDREDSAVFVSTHQYFPETIDIIGLKPKAQIDKLVVKFTLEESAYCINDSLVEMDANPYSEFGRTFVPVRYLAEALGVSDIGWDEQSGTVTLSKGERRVEMVVANNIMITPEGHVEMDVDPQVREGRVYLPARYVAEAFGFYASWEEDTRTVIIQ
ncbi:hypothetical protein N752_18335 [Desulforamulus aquiferis]|nr:hypothetical protein N752_18335 [Desulforamulus aquiferis]